MTDKRREVEELRHEIGKIDAQLLTVARAAGEAVEEDRRASQVDDAPPALPDRGQIEALVTKATGDIPQASASRDLPRDLRNLLLARDNPSSSRIRGLDGGFAHAAARSRFGVAAEYIAARRRSRAAIDEVSRQRASYAVVPFETRADGLLQSTIAALT